MVSVASRVSGHLVSTERMQQTTRNDMCAAEFPYPGRDKQAMAWLNSIIPLCVSCCGRQFAVDTFL